MRICFTSTHKYPGKLYGVAAHAVHDYVVRGLAELGHDVYYCLPEKPDIPLPQEVTYTPDILYNVEILHVNAGGPIDLPDLRGMPWVKIVHSDIRHQGLPLNAAHHNWIYVSQTQACLYESKRYVYNGIDPNEFIYSETKDDYLLFVVNGVHRAVEKGLNIALEVARKTGIELKVAGSSKDVGQQAAFEQYCRTKGATPLGSISGARKAELFAGAKALLFPSQLNEACGLVAIEALMSGTPVIGSSHGAIPEILDKSTGFVCETESDYIQAIENCQKINPQDCRKVAMERFHYLKMSEGYLREYQSEIEYSNRVLETLRPELQA